MCDSCYNRKELDELDSQFCGKACIINFLSEGYDCIYNHAILVNRNGEIIDQDYSSQPDNYSSSYLTYAPVQIASKENIMRAYNEAIEEKYRFFSFGDSMFIK